MNNISIDFFFGIRGKEIWETRIQKQAKYRVFLFVETKPNNLTR